MTKDKRTYDVLIDVWNKAEPYFTGYALKYAKSLPATRHPWRVAPDDKKQKVHVLAGSRQSQIAVFPDAIAVGSPVKGGAAQGGKLALISAPVPILWLVLGVLFAVGGAVFFAVVLLIAGVSACMAIAWAVKGWLCTPSDWPIIFNRKDRTVTFAPVTRFPYWKFWVMDIQPTWCTARWDDVRARSYKYREATTGGYSFHDSYNLMLLWDDQPDAPKLASKMVSIGYQGYFEDELIWMLWEHIRRYMEEDGPAMPHGESLRPLGKGKPIVYPPEVITACGGPPLSEAEVAAIAAAAPAD